MAQELQVVRCYNCEAFQVDIKKKIKKWVCRMCGEKQSLKKVYAKGTGKECRAIVQNLNRQRVTMQNPPFIPDEVDDADIEYIYKEDFANQVCSKKLKLDNGNDSCVKSSKWNEFLCGDGKSNVGMTDFNEDQQKYLESKMISVDSDKKCNIEKYTESEGVPMQNYQFSSVYKNKFESASDLDVDLQF